MQEEGNSNTLGRRLLYLRELSGLNQQKVSDITGISRSNLSKYEQDKVKPTSDAIVNICNFYDVSADWLLRGIETTQKANTISDPDLKRMTDILKELMESDNQNLRGWTMIQFEEAFKKQCLAHDKKELQQ
jgi:transcriptional regulator with XRE-family HTH domain